MADERTVFSWRRVRLGGADSRPWHAPLGLTQE